jgi:hypothetical protein
MPLIKRRIRMRERRNRHGEGEEKEGKGPSGGKRETSYWEHLRHWLKRRLLLLGVSMAVCSCKDEDGVSEEVCKVI